MNDQYGNKAGTVRGIIALFSFFTLIGTVGFNYYAQTRGGTKIEVPSELMSLLEGAVVYYVGFKSNFISQLANVFNKGQTDGKMDPTAINQIVDAGADAAKEAAKQIVVPVFDEDTLKELEIAARHA